MFNTDSSNRELANILLNENGDNICDSFVFSDQPNLGTIFGIIEIFGKDKNECFKFASFLLNEIESIYHLGSIEKDNCILAEQCFEDLLKKLNTKISSLIQTGQLSILNMNFNIVLCMLSPYNNLEEKSVEIFISQIGSPLAFLLHQNKENFQMIDIFTEQETVRINPVKLFSNLIAGKIFFNDKLFITTKNIFNYFNPEKIKGVITDFNAREASEKIGEALSEVPSKENFSAVILNIKMLESFEHEDFAQKSQVSIEHLINTEEETEKILTPSLKGNFTKHFAALKNTFSKNNNDRQRSYTIGAQGKNNSVFKMVFQSLFKIFGLIFILIKNIFLYIIIFFKNVYFFITNKGNYRSNFFSNTKNSISGIPKTSKAVLVVLIVFVLIFIQSIYWVKASQEKKREQAAYENLVKGIENKISEAEASLIYKNEEKSLFIINEAKTYLDQITDTAGERFDKKQALNNDIGDLVKKINHVTEITNPETFVDFAANQPDLQVEKIILKDNLIFAYKSSNAKVYGYNPKDKSMLDFDAIDNDSIINAIAYQDSLIFLHEGNKISEYDFEKKEFQKSNLDLAAGELTDFKIYNDRLYGLSPKNSQIYKFSKKTAAGFGKGVLWLKTADSSLSNAVSMAVDGSIYALNPSGEINKYLSGSKEAFLLEKIEPAFTAAQKIYTELDDERIYILDPINKRLVVFTKNGVLLNQYYSEQFDKLTDFAVDSQNNKIYLLNSSKVFEITM